MFSIRLDSQCIPRWVSSFSIGNRKKKKKKEKIKTANYNKLQYIRETKASQHFSIVELNYDKIEIGMEKKKEASKTIKFKK